MKIALFNCKFSENLGDGLIAETLEAVLRGSMPDVRIACCDLAGRTAYGHTTTPNRARALAILQRLPPPARRQTVSVMLGLRLPPLRETWRAALEGSDLAVVGGGQLFQDGDLNFPLKLGAVFELCAELRVPVAVHAVGVSADWSPHGRALFHRLLATDCIGVSVRDRESQAAWARHFAGTRLARSEIVPDPVLAAEVEPPGPSSSVGINVTHPMLLAYHGGGRVGLISTAAELEATVRLLAAGGHEVVLFSNGATEDERFLDRILGSAPTGIAKRAPRPRVPKDLVATQSRLQAVVAHRLHASILAFRLGLPSVGLGWDRKVESFYSAAGRADYFLPRGGTSAAAIAERVEAAIADGRGPERRAALAGAARRGIVRLLQRSNEAVE
jgi:polysaccharide pyruvyl transferase WcaK-like protein